ncbi:MAG: pantoate--beta-alanine ligase [Thiotrichaceae bacterium]
MIQTSDIAPLRKHIKAWKQQDKTIAVVPTMGNLHAGHLALINKARQLADITIATLFVNPIQFDKQADLDNYPKTYEQDIKLLEQQNCDLVFSPTTETMYGKTKSTTRVEVAEHNHILEGASREGHFSGVATVVAKLFNITTPDFAIFGEKDFQQLIVIRQMVADLNFDIEIIGHPIVREKDNLAMSSRNGYLTEQERKIAPFLNKALQRIKEQIVDGEKDYQTLCSTANETIAKQGFRPDYIEVRRQQDLLEPNRNDKELVIVASAWLGKARLLDNIAFII